MLEPAAHSRVKEVLEEDRTESKSTPGIELNPTILFIYIFLAGSFVQAELDYLKKRSMSDGVTQRVLRDIDLEFTRLNLQIELCLLNHDVTGLNLTLDAPSRQVMRDVRNELSSGKLVENKRLDDLLEKLAAIRLITSLYVFALEECQNLKIGKF